MGRKTSSSKKNDEPKQKRAKMLAEEKNSADLKKLLASKVRGDGVNALDLGPTGHLFVDGATSDDSMAGQKNPGPETDDPLAGEVVGSADDPPGAQAVAFPMPIKTNPVESDDEEQLEGEDPAGEDQQQENEQTKEEEEIKQDEIQTEKEMKEGGTTEEARKKGETEAKARLTPSRGFLIARITEQQDKIREMKARIKILEQDKLQLQNLSLRYAEEVLQLKDKKEIPRAKFTVAPGVPIDIAELESMDKRVDTDAKFVGLLLLKLIDDKKLLGMSVTGKACQRYRGRKNADGSLLYPQKEQLDKNIFQFICDKVAERSAKRHGLGNISLIRAESNESLIRKYIANKIGNLRKAADKRKANNDAETVDNVDPNEKVDSDDVDSDEAESD